MTRRMNFDQWIRLLEYREMRCVRPLLPPSAARPIFSSIADWIEQELFAGVVGPKEQLAYYKERLAGGPGGIYSGSGSSVNPRIINPWEKLGEGVATKKRISKSAAKNEELFADVYRKRGPGFLSSMRALGPLQSSGESSTSVVLGTLATMTPYDPTAGTTRPIMYYLKHGWKGVRASMTPRWPNGIAKWLAEAKPYRGGPLRAISSYIINGR